jgi:hypothetical protein
VGQPLLRLRDAPPVSRLTLCLADKAQVRPLRPIPFSYFFLLALPRSARTLMFSLWKNQIRFMILCLGCNLSYDLSWKNQIYNL